MSDVMKEHSAATRKTREHISYVLLVVVLFTATVIVHRPSTATDGDGGPRILAEFPKTLGEWAGTDVALSDEVLTALGADDYLCRQYRRGDQELTLYITYFRSGNGALTHNPEKCYTASGWAFLDKRTLDVPGNERKVLLSTVGRGDARELVTYWYQDGDRVIVSKLDHITGVLFKTLFGKETHSFVALVAQRIPDPGEVGASDLNLDFVGSVMDALADQRAK